MSAVGDKSQHEINHNTLNPVRSTAADKVLGREQGQFTEEKGNVYCGFVFHKHTTTVGERLLNRTASTDPSNETDGVHR